MDTLFVKKNILIILLSLAACLIFIREPLFLLEPRIWAEEGRIYLSRALAEEPVSALFSFNLGYYSFFNSFIAFIAVEFFPIKYAAYVTTYSSLFIQLATFLLIVLTPSKLLATFEERFLVGIALIILGTPEIWLTTINMQFWLATGAFFLLNGKSLQTIHLIYLAMAFLTGIPSLLFAPFFLIRYSRERDRSYLIVFCMGTIAFFIHLLAFIDYLSSGDNNRLNLDHVTNIFYSLVESLTVTFDFTHLQISVNKYLDIVLFLVFISTLTTYFLKERRELFIYVLFPLILYLIVTLTLSIRMTGGERYAFPVTIAVYSALVLLCKRYHSEKFWPVLPILVLLLHLPGYFQTSRFYDEQWPSWRSQLDAWDGRSPIQVLIFPQNKKNNWSVILDSTRSP
ncbi:MAG: hypothetical protein B6D69_07315 [gamma proteobacterium symbiont of Stewartia floridana]|nr:MAG: hypothetical protein B6D69_07315 [gamma proteobacterium symbiont of Stewartia floridana]